MLNSAEAGRLENWGIWPCCKKSHIHISKTKAIEGAQAGLYRFLMVGPSESEKKPVSMVTLSGEAAMWQPVPTSMPDGSHLMGMRTWGLPRSR